MDSWDQDEMQILFRIFDILQAIAVATTNAAEG